MRGPADCARAKNVVSANRPDMLTVQGNPSGRDGLWGMISVSRRSSHHTKARLFVRNALIKSLYLKILESQFAVFSRPPALLTRSRPGGLLEISSRPASSQSSPLQWERGSNKPDA